MAVGWQEVVGDDRFGWGEQVRNGKQQLARPRPHSKLIAKEQGRKVAKSGIKARLVEVDSAIKS